MINTDELNELLVKLKRKAPEVYRHLIGLISGLLDLAKKI